MSNPKLEPPDHGPLRAMTRKLLARGITNSRLLDVMSRVPRDRFLPRELRSHAFEDRAVPIGDDQTISQPYIVAVMTQELALEGGERVLEIGTGSGYQTAILSELSAEVYTIERNARLSAQAQATLDALERKNIHFRVGDGTLGWPEAAPFDRILVTAGSPDFPSALFDQLVEGGVLVIPLGDEAGQHLTLIRKQEGLPQIQKSIACRFVKLVGEEGWKDSQA